MVFSSFIFRWVCNLSSPVTRWYTRYTFRCIIYYRFHTYTIYMHRHTWSIPCCLIIDLIFAVLSSFVTFDVENLGSSVVRQRHPGASLTKQLKANKCGWGETCKRPSWLVDTWNHVKFILNLFGELLKQQFSR